MPGIGANECASIVLISLPSSVGRFASRFFTLVCIKLLRRESPAGSRPPNKSSTTSSAIPAFLPGFVGRNGPPFGRAHGTGNEEINDGYGPRSSSRDTWSSNPLIPAGPVGDGFDLGALIRKHQWRFAGFDDKIYCTAPRGGA